jgi:hypothetical protein
MLYTSDPLFFGHPKKAVPTPRKYLSPTKQTPTHLTNPNFPLSVVHNAVAWQWQRNHRTPAQRRN